MASWVGDIELETMVAEAPTYVGASFETFYQSELRGLVALLTALCGNRWTAEEMAQDAFLAVYRQWSMVAGYDNPGGFLRRVAINLARSRTRRVAAEARALARYAARQRPDTQPLEPAGEQFWSAVRRLPRRQAEVIALRYLEDLSAAQIATILGCSEATVRVHAHRATHTLACSLQVEVAE